MGWLRVLLALAVLFEHTGGLGGYWMVGGPLAVQAFFIISGFYMGLVLNERYDRPALNRLFWTNRAIRIYSLYFLSLAAYLAVFLLVQWKTGASPLDRYLSDQLPLAQRIGLGLLNVSVIGQDLPLWLTAESGQLAFTGAPLAASAQSVFHYMAIPVAWSLSLELCFYLLAPWIARRPWRQIAALMIISLALRAGCAAFGLVADPFSYRFFPFELALFLAGVLAYKAWAARRDLWARPGMRLLALTVPLATLAYPFLRGDASIDHFFLPQRLFYLTLVALALPAIHAWSQHSKIDRTLGELSYPLYLNHLLVLGLLAGVVEGSVQTTLAVALVGLALAWLTVHFVDARIEAWRRTRAFSAGAA